MIDDECGRTAALAPAWALCALDPDEASFFRSHLATCRRPHPELRESAALAAAIGASLPDAVEPSVTCRRRILEAIRDERES